MGWSYLFIVLTVLFWGVAPLFDKFALKSADPLTGLVVRSIAVLVAIIVAFNFFAKGTFSSALRLPLKTIILFSLSGIFAGFLGMLTYYSAVKKLPISVVVPLCSTYPLIAALLGMILLKEGFSLPKLIGVIFIVIGVWLVK